MSTATNGAATEAAFKAIIRPMKRARTAVADATAIADTTAVADTTALVDSAAVVGSAARASGQAKESTQVWLAASKTITGLSLDAYDASVRAYLDYTESVAAASKAAWAIDLAQGNARIVSELAASYSNAARALFHQ